MPMMRQESAIDPPRHQELEDIEEDDDDGPSLKPQMSQGPPSKK